MNIGIQDFHNGNREVLGIFEEMLRNIGSMDGDIRHWDRKYRFPEGHVSMTNRLSSHLSIGGMDESNIGKTTVTIHRYGEYYIHIGVNGAFRCPAGDFQSYRPGDPETLTGEQVMEVLDWTFGTIAGDLMTRSLADVATKLREKSVGFAALKKAVDTRKEVLNS